MDSEGAPVVPPLSQLSVTLFSLVILALCLIGILLIFRRYRRNRKPAMLPTHHRSSSYAHFNVQIYDEKHGLRQNQPRPLAGPLPQIRITFPDEEDASGKRQSGKVVLLRIGENGVTGMEPVGEENLPPYQEKLQSLDLDRIGGLKEKEHAQRWS